MHENSANTDKTGESHLPDQLSKFLKSGAFYRISQSRFLVCFGPWAPASEDFDFAEQDFFGSEIKGYRAAEKKEMGLEDFLSFLAPVLREESHWLASEFSEPDKSGFATSFQIIQGKIQRGEIEKAVPMVISESKHNPGPVDRAWAISKLIQCIDSLHIFGRWDDEGGVLGATPEILFHRKAMVVQTVAIAGSLPNADSNSRTPLMNDPKELREHELVVNDLITRLKPLGWLKKFDLEILQLTKLQHLKTRLEVTGCAKRDYELVRLLHPTPALGVSPRAYGHSWMRDLTDQKDRGLFGAPFLVRLAADETIALVAIRSIFWNANGSKIGTGCGLVTSSQFEQEWNELLVKRQMTIEQLGLP